MTQVLLDCDRMSFEEFIEWHPEDGKRYELYRGVVREMMPTGTHEDTSGFFVATLNFEIRRCNLPFSIPRSCLLKPEMVDTGFIPDVVVIDRRELIIDTLSAEATEIPE